MNSSAMTVWPELHYDEWSATCSTLHRWTQIAGKIRLAQTPWLNHSWHVPLYVTVTGLTTSPIPCGNRSFEIRFDFHEHVLVIAVSDGASRRLPLRPQSVADFFSTVMGALRDLGIAVAITELPCEIAGAVPFSQDTTHAAYDAEYVARFWRVLLQADRVFTCFRSGFIGKCSPVHFFWGSFDLAVTRFSGRRAPPFAGKAPGLAAKVMQEAYSHEVSSAGFWPGGNGVDAAFYSYAYPEPPGFRTARVQPGKAVFSDTLGEFLLPYDVVRRAADPDGTLLAFLHSTYEAAALSAKWDRSALECPEGRAGICRGID
ncbi:MAG: DUF5996 family protein [Betaproteobacteria bacterium]|jgi:hypothetical protein